jgi:hypothetical protein
LRCEGNDELLVPTPGSGKEGGKMKIVTYNVNGLRPRITQFGSLRNLLNSFDADIICFQVRSFFQILFFSPPSTFYRIHSHVLSFRRPNLVGKMWPQIWLWRMDMNRSFLVPELLRKAEPVIPVNSLFHCPNQHHMFNLIIISSIQFC